MESSTEIQNLTTHHEKLRRQQSYAATASFTQSSGWALAKTGHVLVTNPGGIEQVGIGVGRVLDHKLFCGPMANYNPQFQNATLDKAKYTFTLGRPEQPGFREDFDLLYANLDKLQSSICYGKDRRNMLDPQTKTIRFTCPLFEKREIPILTKSPSQTKQLTEFTVYDEDYDRLQKEYSEKDATYEQSSESTITSEQNTSTSSSQVQEEAELDEDTETWPVPKEVVKEYNEVRKNYRVLPLPVYDAENHFVEPPQVNSALKNALVEIHFGIVHYKIGRNGETHDSFTAAPKQLIVLKPAPIQIPSAYKRKNVRSGPVRPKGFEDFRKDVPSDAKGKNIASGSRG